MKLEIKHICGYLPHEVMMYIYDDIDKSYMVETLISVSVDGFETNYGHYEYNDKDKLLLHPLSDLTKPIVHGGEEITLFEEIHIIASELDFEKDSDSCRWFFEAENFDRVNELGDMNSLPFFLNQMLYKYHFDLFGLIPSGLAIDINTLEK